MVNDPDMTSQKTTPNVSIRKHVRWLPDPATEPTYTLVLTSHTRHYVDIRIFKPSNERTAFSDPDPEVLPTSRLEWAFAGTSISSPISPPNSRKHSSNSPTAISASAAARERRGSGENSTTAASNSVSPTTGHERKNSADSAEKRNNHASHSIWHHWVDSRTTGEVKDEGDMFTVSEVDTLERGRGLHPDTGLESDYEELWRSVPAKRVPSDRGDLVSMVLKAENKDLGTRGMIVRVGGWCQGVLRVAGEMGIERWRYGGGDTVIDSLDGKVEPALRGWERVVRVGEKSLPCQVTWDRFAELSEGKEVVSGGLKWSVVEKYTWA